MMTPIDRENYMNQDEAKQLGPTPLFLSHCIC